MMRLAATRNSIALAASGNGLLLRLRAWFAPGVAEPSADPVEVDTGSEVAGNVTPLDAPSQTIASVDSASGGRGSAVLLPFPIQGAALLVKLADQLRSKIESEAASRDAFDLAISRRPHVRLMIDGAAYVEYQADRAMYHVVIELVHDTRIKVETGDFDTVVKFVAQYVTDRMSDAVTMETAS
jgi:hypothetical protein